MSRMIDADKLQKDISVSDSMTDDYGIKTGYAICMRLVDEQPTIHADPCSVCKWDGVHPWAVCEGCKAEGVGE